VCVSHRYWGTEILLRHIDSKTIAFHTGICQTPNAAGVPVSRLGASRGHGQYPAPPQSRISIGTQSRIISPVQPPAVPTRQILLLQAINRPDKFFSTFTQKFAKLTATLFSNKTNLNPTTARCPTQWNVTPETARLVQHWRSPKFSSVRPFFTTNFNASNGVTC
jgi:hypothetical protein